MPQRDPEKPVPRRLGMSISTAYVKKQYRISLGGAAGEERRSFMVCYETFSNV